MRWSFVLPVLALLLASASVRADDEAEAKAAYARGRSHFKAGRYSEAVTELKRAYALKPHPALLRYMGDTYYKMNKARLAIQHYRKYLQEAPEAPDKDKIEAKVKQLELIVGSGEEEPVAPTPTPTPTPTPGPAPTPTPTPAPSKITDAPTGEDREVPLALRRKSLSEQPTPIAPPPRRKNGLAVAKWTTLGVGVASLVVGIVFNRLAASKASELEDMVRNACPATSPDCGGNPNMDKPLAPYNEDAYNLQQSNNTYRTVSLAMLIVGGVVTGTSLVLFIVDAKSKGSEQPAPTPPPPPRASVAPMLGGNVWGVSGQVRF
jgi:tetratricopeptide (TPR) repeat protein